MSQSLAPPIATEIENVLIGGDLSRLTPEHRLAYYKSVCESVGLNPLTKPFDYLTLNSKMVLYAKRDATDQLRKIHGVSIHITGREMIEGVYIVTASATDKTGRTDESTGAVSIGSLKGDALANATMKAETKAKRRVTLSICGLGILDETEIDTIPNAKRDEAPPPATAIKRLDAFANAAPGQTSAEAMPADPPTETGADMLARLIAEGKEAAKAGKPVFSAWWNREDIKGHRLVLKDHLDTFKAEIPKETT